MLSLSSVAWLTLARLLALTLAFELMGPLWLVVAIAVIVAVDLALAQVVHFLSTHWSDAWVPESVRTVGQVCLRLMRLNAMRCADFLCGMAAIPAVGGARSHVTPQ